jgi:hypothetical protein
MSLDADEVKLTKIGSVTIEPDGFVRVEGFTGDNATCRDVCVLGMVHAMQVLSRELMATIEKPGGGRAGVG